MTGMKPAATCLTIAFALFSTRLFNYAGWNPTYAGWCSYFIYAGIIVTVYHNRGRIRAEYAPLRREIAALIILPLVCAVVISVVPGGHSLYYERRYLPALSAFLFYYIFNVCGAVERDIMRIFTAMALCIFAIQIFQIMYPEQAVFGIYDDGMQHSKRALAEIRNGIYRFRLDTYPFTLICLYYYWNRLCARLTVRDVALFVIFAVSTYLYLTRQIMAATLVALVCSCIFIRKTRARVVYALLIGFLGLVLLQYSDELFGKLISQTRTDITSENVRVIAARFYWEKICAGPVEFLFGNGHPARLAGWGERGLSPSDIGLVGEMFYYGVLWVAMYLYIVYMILVRYGRMLPLYIKLFVLGTLTNSILVFPYRNAGEYLVWAAMLYVASLYIARGRATARKSMP